MANRKFVGFEMPEWLTEKLDEYVKEVNINGIRRIGRSEIIRDAIHEYLEKHSVKEVVK